MRDGLSMKRHLADCNLPHFLASGKDRHFVINTCAPLLILKVMFGINQPFSPLLY